MPAPKNRQANAKLKKSALATTKVVQSSEQTNDIPTASASPGPCDTDMAGRIFEMELCWCIKELENTLNNKNLKEKQMQDLEKNIRVLKSNKQTLVKKRQLMRLLCGNYREKMTAEENRIALARKQIKFSKPITTEKALFLKKANALVEQSDTVVERFSKCSVASESNAEQVSDKFVFMPSNNSFRFNFEAVET